MSDMVIVGLLSLLGTLIGTLGGILATGKLTNFRLERLEEEVKKHNQVIDRMYEAERRISATEIEVQHLQQKRSVYHED